MGQLSEQKVFGTALISAGNLGPASAYDLLGWANGPLRLLTRAVIYPIVFGIDRRPFFEFVSENNRTSGHAGDPIHPPGQLPNR